MPQLLLITSKPVNKRIFVRLKDWNSSETLTLSRSGCCNRQRLGDTEGFVPEPLESTSRDFWSLRPPLKPPAVENPFVGCLTNIG